MERQRRVLLIMPKFFNYPQTITQELQNLGYAVDCFDDRPSTRGFVKAILRVNKDLISRYVRQYFDKVMETVRSHTYDVVLLISGQSLSFDKDMLKELKRAQPAARFVLYQWDSLKNFPYIRRMRDLFDKCYSFDPQDAEENAYLHFLPLFYSQQYEAIAAAQPSEFVYDFSFVGTAHPKKYRDINRMSLQLQPIYENQFIYFFFPSRLVYAYRKICNPELRGAKYSEFHFTPLNSSQMNKLITQTRCILDSPQDGQLGLTIRVFEALGADKKLITSNPEIKKYDFYREENVYVYQGDFDYSSPFFTAPYCRPEPEIYARYSLRSWLKELLDNE